jgi:hypothetical protein
MKLSNFEQSYLTMQGVLILPAKRIVSKPVEEREQENLPRVNEYERGN